jgi:hypothetical protein
MARQALSAMIAGWTLALDAVAKAHEAGIAMAKLGVSAAEALASSIRSTAAAARDAIYAGHILLLAKAREAIAAVAKGASFLVFQMTLNVLEVAKTDTTVVNIAKAALTAAEAVAQAALKAASWLADRLTSTLDVQYVELNASLRSLTKGGAMTIRVSGVIFGQAFDLSAWWSPRDTLSFIIKICKDIWDSFMLDIGRLFLDGQ